jgi:hypothetical protein
MSGYKIFNYKTFEIAELSYQNPSKLRGNIYICHPDKPFDILIQTKDTVLKTGIIENDKEAYIELDVRGTDLHNFIENIDKYNIGYIHKKCKDWFDEELPFQAINEFYISNLNNGILKVAIPYIRKKIEIKVYDDKKNLVEYSDLKEGSKVVLCFRINGLKFLKKQCIMDIDVIQIMLMRQRESSIIPANDVITNQPSGNSDYKNEMLNRIQFKERLKQKKEEARLAFEEAEKTQLLADNLKEKASLLARELKQIEDEYYKDDEEIEEEE